MNNKDEKLIKIKGTGNYAQLIKMLAYIEWCGNVGHSPKALKVFIDGDGSTRFKFTFEDEQMQKLYIYHKDLLGKQFNKNGKDLEFIDL